MRLTSAVNDPIPSKSLFEKLSIACHPERNEGSVNSCLPLRKARVILRFVQNDNCVAFHILFTDLRFAKNKESRGQNTGQ